MRSSIVGVLSFCLFVPATFAKTKTKTKIKHVAAPKQVSLYKSATYHFEILTTTACRHTLTVRTQPTIKKDLLTLGVFVSGSKNWPQNSSWYDFNVMTQSRFKTVSRAQPSGTVHLDLQLTKKNDLLMHVDPQTGPTDVHCQMFVRKA